MNEFLARSPGVKLHRSSKRYKNNTFGALVAPNHIKHNTFGTLEAPNVAKHNTFGPLEAPNVIKVILLEPWNSRVSTLKPNPWRHSPAPPPPHPASRFSVPFFSFLFGRAIFYGTCCTNPSRRQWLRLAAARHPKKF